MDTTREWFVEPEGDRTFTIDGTDYNVTQEEFDRAARELTKIAQTHDQPPCPIAPSKSGPVTMLCPTSQTTEPSS